MRSKKRHHNDGLKKRCSCSRREWNRCVHPWYMQFKYEGRDHRVSLHTIADALGEPKPATKLEAKHLADRVRTEIRNGRNPLAQPAARPVVTGLTFGDVVDRYLVEYAGKLVTKSGTQWSGQYLRPRTAEQAEYHIKTLRQIAVPAANGKTIRLELKPFAEVSTVDVRTVQSVRRPHGAVGCNRLMARLRHLFSWAVAEGMIDHTPFKRGDQTLVKLDTHAETERTRRLDKKTDEVGRLKQHASPHLRALIVAALETGCRLGELLSLQWSQIRWNANGEADEIVLPASKTKTHEPRIIPVSLDLRAELEMRRTDPKGHPFTPEAFVFGNAVGQRVGSVKTAWRNTCRRAGISELHFHDLRREFASDLLERSTDLSVVREFLGHANITTTSRYLKTTTTRMREALEQREVSPEPPSDVAESLQASEVQ